MFFFLVVFVSFIHQKQAFEECVIYGNIFLYFAFDMENNSKHKIANTFVISFRSLACQIDAVCVLALTSQLIQLFHCAFRYRWCVLVAALFASFFGIGVLLVFLLTLCVSLERPLFDAMLFRIYTNWLLDGSVRRLQLPLSFIRAQCQYIHIYKKRSSFIVYMMWCGGGMVVVRESYTSC